MSVLLDEIEAAERFLELIASGVGPINAGYEVDWPPAKTRKLLADPEFAILVADAQERNVESIEQAVMEKAKNGHVRAAEMVLFSKYADRGWVPPAHRVHVRGEMEVKGEIVASVKEAAKQLVREVAIAELQGPTDDPEDIIDAEVVDDDDS